MEISEERKSMYDQIVSQPALIREMCEPIDALIRATLNRDECQKWQRIFLAGCGDSYYTGLACELAIEQFAGLPAEPMSSLHFSRYSIDFVPPHSVLFGISNSGRVSRSIEAVILAREAGMETVAITGNPGSPITSEAHLTLGVKIPAISPGVRSYTISLLTTLLTALYLGECRGTVSAEKATQLRSELREVADLMEETNGALINQCQSLAETLEKEDLFIFVGGGPNYATALFSAAKIVEACGSHASGQDIEEWAHIEYFNTVRETPTIVFSAPGRCYDRTLELLPAIKGIGRNTIAIAESQDSKVVNLSTSRLSIKGKVREAFSPLLYSLPGEFLACFLAELKKEQFFRRGREVPPEGRDRITKSQILRSASPSEAL